MDPARIDTLLDDALCAFQALGMEAWVQRVAAQRSALEASPSGGPAVEERPGGLTAREAEVLSLLASGQTSQEIADQLVLSLSTVQRHIANIYNKIDVRNRAEATAYALHHGLASGRP